MLLWEILTLFISSFSITSYCVHINCLNQDDTYYEPNEDKIKYYKLKNFDEVHDIYRLEEVEESDY